MSLVEALVPRRDSHKSLLVLGRRYRHSAVLFHMDNRPTGFDPMARRNACLRDRGRAARHADQCIQPGRKGLAHRMRPHQHMLRIGGCNRQPVVLLQLRLRELRPDGPLGQFGFCISRQRAKNDFNRRCTVHGRPVPGSSARASHHRYQCLMQRHS